MRQFGQDEFVTKPDSKVKIKVLVDKCISAATCLIQAPNTFDLDEDEKAFVLETEWDDAITIVQAAKSCSTSAIIIEDLRGNQVWPKKKQTEENLDH